MSAFARVKGQQNKIVNLNMDTPTRNRPPTPTIKWVCSACGADYPQEQAKCDQDGAELRPVIIDHFIGKVFADRYEILSRLGHGGMSTVYKARHLLMDKICAIKLMHANLVTDQKNVRRFQVESKAASALSHPNLIKVNDFGITSDGIPYLVMECLEGQTLNEILLKQEYLTVELCLNLMKQVLDGLAHAHDNGIIHRDLKPGNIMILTQPDGAQQAMIVDFGIAKVLEADSSDSGTQLTMIGEVFGSPAYMSPEQCSGTPVDLRSDIYAMGCMIYQCLSGKPPLLGATAIETFSMQIKQMPEPIHKVCPQANVPPLVEDVVFKALEKDPAKRYASAAHFSKSLTEAYEKSREQEAVQFLASRLQSRLLRFKKRLNQNLVAVCTCLLLFVSGTIALVFLNPAARQFTHTAVNPSLYAINLLCGRLTSKWNYDWSKRFLTSAVREADYGKVTDNQINSRDELQKLYDRYGFRNDYKQIDGQIKSIKSDWLMSRLRIKMSDEDKLFTGLLEEMAVPTDPKAAREMAVDLSNLAARSLKRGSYNLAEKQSSKAIYIWDDMLHDHSEQALQSLDLLSLSYERMGRLGDALQQSKRLLSWQTVSSSNPHVVSSELTIARIELMQGHLKAAEKDFKKAIISAGTAGSSGTNILKEALNDYAAFLRRF